MEKKSFFSFVRSERDARFRSSHTSFEYVCRKETTHNRDVWSLLPIAHPMEQFSHGFWSEVIWATSRFKECESISCESQCIPEMQLHEFMGQTTSRHYFACDYWHRLVLRPTGTQNSLRKIEWCVCAGFQNPLVSKIKIGSPPPSSSYRFRWNLISQLFHSAGQHTPTRYEIGMLRNLNEKRMKKEKWKTKIRTSIDCIDWRCINANWAKLHKHRSRIGWRWERDRRTNEWRKETRRNAVCEFVSHKFPYSIHVSIAVSARYSLSCVCVCVHCAVCTASSVHRCRVPA